MSFLWLNRLYLFIPFFEILQAISHMYRVWVTKTYQGIHFLYNKYRCESIQNNVCFYHMVSICLGASRPLINEQVYEQEINRKCLINFICFLRSFEEITFVRFSQKNKRIPADTTRTVWFIGFALKLIYANRRAYFYTYPVHYVVTYLFTKRSTRFEGTHAR